MFKRTRTNVMRFIGVLTVLAATGAMTGTARAQKEPVQKPRDQFAQGQDQVKQLLVLASTDKNGKVSKEDFIKFVETEVDRLNLDEKSGALDTTHLVQPILHPRPFSSYGK